MSGAGDKRSVATDALATLGTIIDEGQKRDAIHLAVEPVIAGQRLSPGDHVAVENGVARRRSPKDCLGIVDPFLGATVEEGERFWFVMYPRMVHSLRHVWTHPAFPDSDGVASVAHAPKAGASLESAQWLRAYASELGIGLADLIDGADDWLAHGDALVGGENFEGVSTKAEFWDHYVAFTGKEVPKEKREDFFRCAC